MCNGKLSATVAHLAFFIVGHDAGFDDGGAELLRGAVEFLGPVADFVGFVDVDAGAVGWAAVLEVVGHSEVGLVEWVKREKIGES